MATKDVANGQIASIFILSSLHSSLNFDVDAFIHALSFSFNEVM
jgi:hypothetical protein